MCAPRVPLGRCVAYNGPFCLFSVSLASARLPSNIQSLEPSPSFNMGSSILLFIILPLSVMLVLGLIGVAGWRIFERRMTPRSYWKPNMLTD
jgi:hypothetical protein